ncbi:hypothetical protein [Streptomyces tendae]|uniref:hypothetical protein n=1 Tax=Streptomyces tendae TaxID=1932 RepID=UPI003721188B
MGHSPPGPDAAADSGYGYGYGYGYQFWTEETGIYNASGIFGQECMVFPDHDGVVVVTGAMGEGTYHDLPGMLRRAFVAAFDSAYADPATDAAEREAVRLWTGNAQKPRPLSSAARRRGFTATYDFDTNEQGLRSLSLAVSEDRVRIVLEDERGPHAIDHGVGHGLRQETRVSSWRLHHAYQDPSALVLAGAEWSAYDDARLRLVWHFLESPFVDLITLSLEPDGVTVEHRVNVNSGATELPPVTGRLRGPAPLDSDAVVTDQLAPRLQSPVAKK